MKTAIRMILAVCALAGCLAPRLYGDATTQPATTQPAATQPTDAQPASVEVLSVQIDRPLTPELARSVSILQRGTQTMTDRNADGVKMILIVRLPDREIVSLGEKALSISKFVDDKYNDLGHSANDRRAYYGNWPQQNIAEKGHAVVLAVNSEHAPAADASRILLRGNVSVETAHGEKVSPKQKLALRPGKTIDVGPVPLSIRSLTVGSGQMVQMALSAEQSIAQIMTLRFFNPATGKEIAFKEAGRYDAAAQSGRNQSTLNLILPENYDEVEVEVKYHEAVEQVTIPIEVQADLGVATAGRLKIEPATGRPAAPAPGAGLNGSSPFPEGKRADASGSDQTRTVWPPRERIAFPASRPALLFPTTRPAFPPPPREAAAGPVKTAPAIPEISTQVISLGISRMLDSDARAQWNTRSTLLYQPYGGTYMRLMLNSPRQDLLEVDPRSLQVERFVDDVRGDLSPAQFSDNSSFQPLGPSHLISSDAQHAIVYLAMNDAPTHGATRIAIRGSVVAQMGVHRHVVEYDNVHIDAGATVVAGPSRLTIHQIFSTHIGSPAQAPAGAYPISMAIATNQSLDLIGKIEFFTEKGRPLTGQLSRMRPYGNPERAGEPSERSFNYTLSEDVDHAKVKITYYDQVESKVVPIEVITGLGL